MHAEPLVDAPAHALPIEYWTGPGADRGARMLGRPVSGWGFDERSRPWVRGHELARALRLTVEHPDDIDGERRERISPTARREVEALALRGDPPAAAEHARRHIHPWMTAARPKARALTEDLLVALSGRFRDTMRTASRRALNRSGRAPPSIPMSMSAGAAVRRV